MENEEKNLFLLNLYFEEWKFRQENLWKRILQFFVVIFFVSTLPLTIGIFNGVKLPQISVIMFPIAGILLTLFFLWFCLAESIRINTIDGKIKRIMADHYPEEYVKNELVPLTKPYQKKEKTWAIFRWRMAIWVPVTLSAMEIVIAIAVIFIIIIGALPSI
ncbi:hypothetical protein [Desulfitobacterium chlororespirans]|uniref:Uncharacterized protein n=1 Tax=Desulfitobacterium chlororespirans DSM 11544 TaxID=1121395 RepID=A0A1M7UZY0_9FIRM|nr:hypothetical protein [Desulfitobacterium chlororespirans]SHN88504.1 hypothetical protein SAMN02745215_05371 [Desulfitobacterium chlororespirans DSM 11544]